MNTLDFRKRAIMSTLDNVEKTVKVEGDKIIKFNNDTDYKITNFKLYGWTNEIGEGEKSPDNPYTFEHYENPSITVRGTNLLDASKFSYNGYYKSQVTFTDTGIKFKGSCYSPIDYCDLSTVLKPNTTYYIHIRRILKLNDGTPYCIEDSTCSQISGDVLLNIDGKDKHYYVPYINNISGSDIEYTRSFTTPESWTSIKLQTYGTSHSGNLEDGTAVADIKMMDMELKDIWLGTEPFERYEPYKEPQTITLNDVTLRGLLSNVKADTLYTNSIDWKGYAIDGKAYWSDSLQYDNGRVYLAEDVQECIAIDYAYNGDLVYEDENNDNICQATVVFKAKVLGQPNEDYVVNTWFSAKTSFVPSDYTVGEVAIYSQRSTHFKTTINAFWTMARYDKYKNHFCTGDVHGSWYSFYGHSVSKSVATTKAEIATYMKNLWNTQEVHYIMPCNTTERDISDTNTTALKQLLSQSFSGTTIIETNGYIKAEFKYKE